MTNAIELGGVVYEVGSDGWFFYSGMLLGLGFMLFGLVKRLVVRGIASATGSGSDF